MSVTKPKRVPATPSEAQFVAEQGRVGRALRPLRINGLSAGAGFWGRATMRNALGLMLASVVTAVVIAGVWFWTDSPRADVAAPQSVAVRPAETLPATATAKSAPKREDVEVTAAIPEKAPVAPQPKNTCANPDALGVSRVVEIDTTRGPAFGFQHFKQLDFLTDKEVVLTFDDGPWPVNTPLVLKALADECTKAVFFPIGKHATYHPEILKQGAPAGHTA